MKPILIFLKVIVFIIILALFTSAAVFVFYGVYVESIQIFKLFNDEAEVRRTALLTLLEVVDMFLIALVLIILGIGLTQLFIGEHIARHSEKFEWLHFHNFTELKLLLWKMILTTMLVSFFVTLYHHKDNLEWTMLIFPASILLISVSLYIIKKSKNNEDS